MENPGGATFPDTKGDLQKNEREFQKNTLKRSRIPVRIISKTDDSFWIDQQNADTNEEERVKTVKESLRKHSKIPVFVGGIISKQEMETPAAEKKPGVATVKGSRIPIAIRPAKLSDVYCSLSHGDVPTEGTREPVIRFNEEVKLVRYEDLIEEIKPLKTYSGSNLRNFRRVKKRRRVKQPSKVQNIWKGFIKLFKCCGCSKGED